MADKIKAFIAGTPESDMWIVIERNTDNLKDSVKDFEDDNGNVAFPIQGDELQAIQNAIITWQSERNLDRAIKKYKDKLKV
jgi:hypothetical protein